MKLPSSIKVLERGWLSSNNIILIDDNLATIIDTGYVLHSNQTLRLVKKVLGERDLNFIINTHLHSDHCGGNSILQNYYKNVETLVPFSEVNNVLNWNLENLSFHKYGQKCDRFFANSGIKNGDIFFLGSLNWIALSSPGHDHNSFIFFNESKGILISADALWEKGFGVIFPEMDGESGFLETRNTLDLISNLDARIVIPGHGRPFTDLKKSLAYAISRLNYLEQDSFRNAKNGLKVILKFLLMEKQKIKINELPTILNDIPIIKLTNERFMKYNLIFLVNWLISDLVKSKAAKVQNGNLVNIN